MHKRTFFRTMIDKFLNNSITKTVFAIVNFCNEQRYFRSKKLKFLQNMSIQHVEAANYDNRFLFNGKLKVENGK